MPDEVRTEPTRPDAPSVDDALFGDSADDKNSAAVDKQDSDAENAKQQQGTGDAGHKEAGDKSEQDPQGSDVAAEAEGEQETQDSGDAGDEGASTEDDLKVVVSIKGGKATIGVQKPSADPHIETFEAADILDLAHEVLAVTERARARWEDAPKYPAYARPVPPPRRRRRPRQGVTQDSTDSDAETEQTQAEPQTLRLF